MASIEKRNVRGQDRFLVRYRDPSGKQKARTFKSKKEAVDYGAEVRTDLRRGAYFDPQGGQTKVKQWADKWLTAHGDLKPSTRARYKGLLDVQILPSGVSTVFPMSISWMFRVGLRADRLGPVRVERSAPPNSPIQSEHQAGRNRASRGTGGRDVSAGPSQHRRARLGLGGGRCVFVDLAGVGLRCDMGLP